VVLVLSGSAWGGAFNVSTVAELRVTLTEAQANGEDDTINLAAGTYSVSSVLTYSSSENHSLELAGAGQETCILDGGDTTQILTMNTAQDNADVTLRNLTLQNGSTPENGGALNVAVDGADVTLQDCNIADSETTGDESVGGGAVCSSETGTVTVESCGIYRNRSGSNVGGLYVATSSGTGCIVDCTFEDNTVNNIGGSEYFGDGGGAMFYSGGISTGHISGNTFTGNSASGGSNPDGGGLMTYQLGAGSALTLDQNLFDGNTAGLDGGGCILRFNNTGNEITVTNNIFRNNETTERSGAGAFLYMNEADLTYSGNTHTNNIAHGTVMGRGAGAEIEHHNGVGLITGNRFTSNQAGTNGGGLSVPCETATLTITKNIFDSNTAGNVGGGLSYSTISGSLTLSRNTWYGNEASSDGGGGYIYLEDDAATNTIRNNILWNDTPNELAGTSAAGPADLTMTYSDAEGSTGEDWFGTGCIAEDPLFVDPGKGNFGLSKGSPCIDTGDIASPPDPDGSRADMGAVPYGESDGEGVTVSGVYMLAFMWKFLSPNNKLKHRDVFKN